MKLGLNLTTAAIALAVYYVFFAQPAAVATSTAYVAKTN